MGQPRPIKRVTIVRVGVAAGDGVDELDIALLDALHVNPQASFEELGRTLDISPVTAARRWRRLVSTGRAWVSSAIGPRLPVRAALFEAECRPGAAQQVAAEFASRPQVFSVNITTGADNIYALLVAVDQPLLSELIVDVLPEIWVSNTDHLRRAFFYVRHPDFPFRGKPYSPYYTSSPIVRFADFWWLAVTALGARQERFMAGGPPSTTFVYTIPAQDAPRW